MWKDDLIWCPSQCYLEKELNGQKYTLYLRWRWENPWSGNIIKHVEGEEMARGGWSYELFSHFHVQYSVDELELAKEWIEEIWNKFESGEIELEFF